MSLPVYCYEIRLIICHKFSDILIQNICNLQNFPQSWIPKIDAFSMSLSKTEHRELQINTKYLILHQTVLPAISTLYPSFIGYIQEY